MKPRKEEGNILLTLWTEILSKYFIVARTVAKILEILRSRDQDFLCTLTIRRLFLIFKLKLKCYHLHTARKRRETGGNSAKGPGPTQNWTAVVRALPGKVPASLWVSSYPILSYCLRWYVPDITCNNKQADKLVDGKHYLTLVDEKFCPSNSNDRQHCRIKLMPSSAMEPNAT